MKMSEFITLGEPLVVFCSTQLDKSIADATNFDKVIGGAELNVAVGVQRLGHSTQYISRVGKDPQGDFIKTQINKMKIGTQYLDQTPAYLTGYQMKQLVSHGDPFVFNFRKDSAAAHFNLNKLNYFDYSNIKFAHLTGIFPAISELAYETSMTLLQNLNKNKVTVTFDPNLRPQLWPNHETMISSINELAQYADVVLPGQKEGKILTGHNDPESIADFYLTNSQTKVVFVKVGSKGSYFKNKLGESAFIKGFKVQKVVDTVGAGDGFAVGVITSLMEGKSDKEAALRGNAIGALQVQTHGDNDGYPDRNKLKKFYKGNGVVFE